MHYEQRLEQKLVQKQTLQMQQKVTVKQTLKQYLEQEDFIKTLITYANTNDTWTEFNKDGFKFTYAKIPYELAKPIAKEYGYAFSHCMYDGWEAMLLGKKYALAQGDWIKFLVADKLLGLEADYFAIHEYGEELSLGNHYFASKLEFGYAEKNKHSKEYTQFIDAKFPSKFVDLQENVLFPILPEELIEIITAKEQSSQKQKELKLAEEIIEKYPVPNIVITKIKQYSFETDRICRLIDNCTVELQNGIYHILNTTYSTEQVASYIDKTIRESMKNLNIKSLNALSKPRIEQSIDILINHGLEEVRKNIKSRIIVETNLVKLVQKSKIGQSIVNIEYTPEELTRMRKR